jgi:hypothetical protein
VLLAVAVAAAGCGGSKRVVAPDAVAGGAARDAWGTVWLCRPGEPANPCASSLATTVLRGGKVVRVERLAPAASPPVDCFYVYPTVSGQTSVNANLRIDLRLRLVAAAQAARFSQVCRVYAPVYRQITLSALDHPGRITLADAFVAYRSVLSAFRDYLEHYNHGRGIVFIGHSQGAVILIKLLREHVDSVAGLRQRLVSALLLGGNVTVARGRSVGGDFAHIPACRSSRQTGCVVAYSSFSAKPPPGSQFGRTTSDAGVELLAPHHRAPDVQIMCVNPAAPAGETAPLHPAIPSPALGFFPGGRALSIATPWVALPGRYTGRCETAGDATWLQITPVRRPDPLANGLRDAAIGLHILDVNIALDDLVHLVHEQGAAYVHR